MSQVGVYFDQFVQIVADIEQCLGILIGLKRLLVGSDGGNLLTDHDDRQQNKLQKCLRDPGDQSRCPGVNCLGKADEREYGERIRTPHSCDAVGYLDCKPAVKAGMLTRYGMSALKPTEIEVRMRNMNMGHQEFFLCFERARPYQSLADASWTVWAHRELTPGNRKDSHAE